MSSQVGEGLRSRWTVDIGVFAIILGGLSGTTCMSADGQANLAALHDKQEQFTYSPCFVARQSSFASETRSLA